MDNNHPLVQALKNLTHDLRLFIELSLQEEDAEWEEWLRLILKESEVKCWERKNCSREDCPAFNNITVRCWLIAGTMCGGKPQGEFAIKYKNCTQCDVYQAAVFRDPVTEIYEHIITLVHSLKNTQDKLKTMAIRDPLTGVYNRNFFNEIIANEIERSRRYGDRFSIIMIDIDNFKQINDHHGHLIGDWILREFALLLNRAIRSSDLLVRFGGDEFLVVTHDTDFKECDALILRINGFVSDWNERHHDFEYKLSTSIGCSVYEKGRDLIEILKEADSRMYQNKLNKRGLDKA
ncbi:MAG: GGDEF domain-containing protein [Thermodesulfovibrionales bacterium]